MDLTPEERKALRDMLARIRAIAEDFVQEYYGRMLKLAPKDRFLYLNGGDGGQFLLWNLVDTVELCDAPERLAETLAMVAKSGAELEELSEQLDVRVECFYWTAKRCLGDAFTPMMRSGHKKLTAITGKVALSGTRRFTQSTKTSPVRAANA